jgi:hypothetical protein
MALPAVFAEQILPRLLVSAHSAAYCRWTMYGLDMSCLLPFSGKALAAVVDGTSKSAIVYSWFPYLIASLLISMSPNNRALYQATRMNGVVLSLSDIHGLGCRTFCVYTWG